MKEDDLKYADFWEKLGRYIRRTEMDYIFNEPREAMEQYEYIYDKLRETLDPQEEDDLVLYVASCEEYCKAFAFAAYEMGREEGPRET